MKAIFKLSISKFTSPGKRPSKANRGFTIVELLIVIIVIAILATLVITAYNGVRDKANLAKMQSEMKNMVKLIEIYKAENGSYPYSWPNYKYSYSSGNNFIPGIVPTYASSLPEVPGSPTIQNTYIYRSDGVDYKLERLHQPTLPSYEAAHIDPSTKDSGYDDRWGYWSSGGASF